MSCSAAFCSLISLSLVNWSGNPLAGVIYSIASLIPCAVVTYVWAIKVETSFKKSNEGIGAAFGDRQLAKIQS